MPLGKLFSQIRQLIEVGEHALAIKAAEENTDVLHQVDEDGHTLLHTAACQPDISSLARFIELGAPVEGVDPSSFPTPLHFAASLNLVAACRTLVEAGANVQARDAGQMGGTPLVCALFYGARHVADYLGEIAVAPDNLRVAAGLGLVPRVAELLEAGPLEAGREREWYRPHEEYPSWTPSLDEQEILDEALWYASVNGRLDVVKILIKEGADPTALAYWSTALHCAQWAPHHNVIDYLVQAVDDFTVRDKMYEATVAEWTDFAGDEETRETILRAASGQDAYAALICEEYRNLAHIADGGNAMTSVLVKAYELQSGRGIRILEACGVKLDVGTAIAMGRVDLVSEWIEGEGPNEPFKIPTPVSGEGTTQLPRRPVNHAAYCRQDAVVEVLRAAGATIDCWAAAAVGDLDLLEAFEEIDEHDPFGRTPLHRAIQAHATVSVRYLLENGASVEESTDTFAFGGQALHLAARVDAPSEILELLIHAGADINSLRNPGTPLDVAMESEAIDAAQWLEQHGALTTQQMRHELLAP